MKHNKIVGIKIKCEGCGKDTARIVSKSYLKYSNIVCNNCYHISHSIPDYIPRKQHNSYWNSYIEKYL